MWCTLAKLLKIYNCLDRAFFLFYLPFQEGKKKKKTPPRPRYRYLLTAIVCTGFRTSGGAHGTQASPPSFVDTSQLCDPRLFLSSAAKGNFSWIAWNISGEMELAPYEWTLRKLYSLEKSTGSTRTRCDSLGQDTSRTKNIGWSACVYTNIYWREKPSMSKCSIRAQQGPHLANSIKSWNETRREFRCSIKLLGLIERKRTAVIGSLSSCPSSELFLLNSMYRFQRSRDESEQPCRQPWSWGL